MTKLFTILFVSLVFSGLALGQVPVSQSGSEAAAQQPKPSPTPAPVEVDVVKITTNLVQVDAVVTDGNGKVVTDLRPEEVEILEDGKSQKITHFSFVSLNPSVTQPAPSSKPDKNTPPIPPVTLRPGQVRRTIALVVDDLGLSFESMNFVRRALKKFVDEQVQPGDLVAIIRTGGGVGALQQFTSDPRQLYAAIDRVKWTPIGRSGISAFAPIGTTLDENLASAEKNLDDFRDEIFSVGTLGAMGYVIRGMKDLPGRKSMVLFSDGLRIFNREDPLANARILAALRSLTDRANRASVVIYTIDARGLPVLGFSAQDSASGGQDRFEQQLSQRRSDYFDSQNGLYYISERTGGFFVHDSNDLSGGIRKVLEDQKSYYLIGYRPDDSTFQLDSGRRKFHKLSLKIRRSGKFNVRIRNGFYGVSDDEAAKATGTPRERLYRALLSPFGSADIHVRLTSFFAHDEKIGAMLRSMLHIRATDLVFKEQPDGSYQGQFDVVAIAFGDNGMVVDQLARTHTVELKGKAYEQAMREGFIYNITIPIKKPGAYQLRTALRDRNSELIGSASQFVEVPNIKKNRLVLSGIVARGMSIDAYKKLLTGATPATDNADNTVEETPPGTSPALREFRQGMAMVFGVEIYNAQVDKATGKIDLEAQHRVFKNGKLLYDGKPIPFDAGSQPDPKRVTLVGGIQLGSDMEPGEYVFQIVVKDRLAKEKNNIATQWITFDIVGR
jgi:VWFA-related protein